MRTTVELSHRAAAARMHTKAPADQIRWGFPLCAILGLNQ
jgi:hypothetical protein